MMRMLAAYWSITTRIMRFFFRHLYTTLAWSYDFVAAATSVGQWTTWRRTVLEHLPAGRLLELGHGTGHLLRDLRTQGTSVVGIDPSPQMTHIAAERLRAVDEAVCSARACAQSLPFPPRIFHAAFATFPSEFILDERTLQEVHRVLVEGGSLVIVGLAQIEGNGILDRLASYLYRVTGQSGELREGWDLPLKRRGFSASLERITLPRATVLHVRAVKSLPDPKFASPQASE